jgi:PAT family acetyl-CoA transporter-like MFS transporter 1
VSPFITLFCVPIFYPHQFPTNHLLASVSNLGGTFPRLFVLRLVDTFTVATCNPALAGTSQDKLDGVLVTEPFSCALQPDKERCIAGGGTCVLERDGYYLVNMLCVLFGLVTFIWYIRPRVARLQALPLKAWRLAGSEVSR